MAVADRGLEGLCAELGPRLYRLALARTGQPADAEDLAQEALLRLIEARADGQVIDNPLNWTLRLVTNAVKRRGRHGWRWVPVESAERSVDDQSSDATAIVQGQLSNAAVAFSTLRSKDRAHVLLADLQEWADSDLAEIFECSASGARMRVMRSREQLVLAYMRLAVGFSPQTGDCQRAGVLIPRACASTLDQKRSAWLEAHVAECDACESARKQLRQLVKDALTAVFPLPPDDLRRRLAARLTAALLAESERRRPSSILGWLWPARSSDPRRRRTRPALLLLLLLLLTVLMTPHSPYLPYRFQVESLRTSRADPPPGGAADVTPSPLVSAPQPRPSPSSAPSPMTYDPCPAQPTGAYAYLDRGEVYLRSGLGAAPQQMTATAGRVDYYWWSPNGALIAYKTAAGDSTLGTVTILQLATRHILATLSQQAIFFSFSPDSSSWVTAAPIVGSTSFQGGPGFNDFQVRVGSIDSGRPRTSFTVAGIPNDTQPWPGNYAEQPELPTIVANEPWGVYWLSDAIYLDQGMGGQMTHSFSSVGDAPDGWTMQSDNLALQNRLWEVPAASAFALHPASGDSNLYVTCTGQRRIIWQPEIAGPAETLSVSPDGRTALITDAMLYPCRNDNYLVTADAVVTKLDGDCFSSLARWQP